MFGNLVELFSHDIILGPFQTLTFRVCINTCSHTGIAVLNLIVRTREAVKTLSSPSTLFFGISPASCNLLGAHRDQEIEISALKTASLSSPLLLWLAIVLLLSFSLPRLPPSLRRSLIQVPIWSAEPLTWARSQCDFAVYSVSGRFSKKAECLCREWQGDWVKRKGPRLKWKKQEKERVLFSLKERRADALRYSHSRPD